MNRATVIIPNLNGREYLRDCLDSLLCQSMRDFDIIVVDNGSGDGSPEMVRRMYPMVTLRQFRKNTGFCHAVNAGIKMAQTPYVILLNNDTKAEAGFVEALVGAMDRLPGAFSASALMLSMKEPSLADDAGDFYCAFGWAFARGKGKSAARYRKEIPVFACCGGASIYRRSLLEETGLFDERFFAYLEDMDLGFRARLLGYKNLFVPEARVLHAGSASSGARYNAFKVRHTARNNLFLLKKNLPLWQRLLNAPLILAGWLIKAAFFARQGLLEPYLRGTRAGLLSSGWQQDRIQAPVSRRMKIQLELWVNTIRRCFP